MSCVKLCEWGIMGGGFLCKGSARSWNWNCKKENVAEVRHER